MEAIIGAEFPKKVIPLIQNAKKEIKVVVFDWRWYPNDVGNPVSLFNQSIVLAVRRGVACSVITNSADVVRTLVSVGVKAKQLQSKNLVHAKMIIIDDKIVIVGSHNYTQPAFTSNHEISMIHDDEVSALGFIEFFNKLWNI